MTDLVPQTVSIMNNNANPSCAETENVRLRELVSQLLVRMPCIKPGESMLAHLDLLNRRLLEHGDSAGSDASENEPFEVKDSDGSFPPTLERCRERVAGDLDVLSR